MKYIKTITLAISSLLFIQCSNSNFKIAKKQVGQVDSATKVSDLKDLFKNDSLIVRLSESDLGTEKNYFTKEDDQYLVYEKGGKHLLTIVPSESHDKNAKIKYIQLHDPRYKTDSDVSLNSDFKTIHANYQINNIEPSFTSVTLYIDELNATIALDKKDVGLNGFIAGNISPNQIPDTAKAKYFTIWFE